MLKRKLIVILSFIFAVSLCFAVVITGCKGKDNSSSSSGSDSSGGGNANDGVTITLNVTSLDLVFEIFN